MNSSQGPYFSEVDLSQIAQEFDERERQLMMESGIENEDYLNYVANESENVNNEGNFSIQVLRKALENMNLVVLAIGSCPEVLEDPSQEDAFICNLESHWFAIRKVAGHFFNLNSIEKGPSLVSSFYLKYFCLLYNFPLFSMLLSQLKAEGYSIFVVRGIFPAPDVQESFHGHWFEVTENGKLTTLE